MMTLQHTIQPKKRLPTIETGRRCINIRTQWATREWTALRIDYEHALEQLAIARRTDIEQLDPLRNLAEAEQVIREAAIGILASREAKLCDLPTLIRLAALIAGRHDPAWLRPDEDEYGAADAALHCLYVQALRVIKT